MALISVTVHPHALGSVEDVKQYLQLNEIPTGDAAEIFKTVINSATDKVETYCGRPFVERTITEFYDGKGDRRLFLRAHPVTEIVQIDNLDFEGSSVRTYGPADVRLDSVHGVVMLSNGSVFGKGMMNWQVQYKASYALLTDVPDAVRLGFFKLCAEYWRDYENRTDRVQSISMDGQLTLYNQDPVPPDIVALLKPYAIPAGMGSL